MANKYGPNISEAIDPTTGEVIPVVKVSDLENFTLNNKEATEKQRKYLKLREEKSKFDTLTGGFTFTMLDTLKELIADDTFTQADKARIMLLGTYVSYSDKGAYLVYRNNKPITKSHLMQLLEMTRKGEFYSFYNKLLEAEIITEVPTDNGIQLQWSSKYHFKGNVAAGGTASGSVFKSYDKQIQDLYFAKNEKGKRCHTVHTLFYIFMLVPFIDPYSNMVVKNPGDLQHAKQPFTLKDLADLMGYSEAKNAKNMLRKLKLHGMPVVSINTAGKHTNIVINPFVINRTGRVPSGTLLGLFIQSVRELAATKGWTEDEILAFINNPGTAV